MAKIIIKTREEIEEEKFLASLIPSDEEVRKAELQMEVIMILMEVM